MIHLEEVDLVLSMPCLGLAYVSVMELALFGTWLLCLRRPSNGGYSSNRYRRGAVYFSGWASMWAEQVSPKSFCDELQNWTYNEIG